MGLDDFKSSPNTRSSGSSKGEDNNKKDVSGEETKNERNIDIGKLDDAYDEDYLRECHRCGQRKIKLRCLSKLGVIWYCENDECISSIKYTVEVRAKPMDLADEIDVEQAQRIISRENVNPENMALDDFTKSEDEDHEQDENGEKEDNKRVFCQFDEDDFEDALEETPLDFEEVDYDWAEEKIYQSFSEDDTFAFTVYSSIDKRTGKARNKDDDAIRVVVLETNDFNPVISEKRVNRIQTWKKNLKKRIKSMLKKKDEIVICDECGEPMVLRDGKNGKFYGCSTYPNCRNTKDYEQG